MSGRAARVAPSCQRVGDAGTTRGAIFFHHSLHGWSPKIQGHLPVYLVILTNSLGIMSSTSEITLSAFAKIVLFVRAAMEQDHHGGIWLNAEIPIASVFAA